MLYSYCLIKNKLKNNKVTLQPGSRFGFICSQIRQDVDSDLFVLRFAETSTIISHINHSASFLPLVVVVLAGVRFQRRSFRVMNPFQENTSV